METFSALLWINGRVNNREAGDLRRHRARYDVIVMILLYTCDDRNCPVAKKRNHKLRIPVPEGTQIFFQEYTNEITCASIFRLKNALSIFLVMNTSSSHHKMCVTISYINR